jgi:hypothetical protein
MGDVHGGALGAMGGDGIPVAETVGVDVVGPHLQGVSVGGDRCKTAGFGVDGGDLGGLGGHPRPLWSGGEADDPVPGPVAAPAGCGQLRAGEQPGSVDQGTGDGVEGLDVVAAVGEHEGVSAGGGVGRPRPDHGSDGPAPVGHGMDTAGMAVPGDSGGELPVPEMGRGGPLAGVSLAEVIGERPQVLGVTVGQGPQSAAGADSTRSRHRFVLVNRACFQGKRGRSEGP